MEDTICAISTAIGLGAISIIRVSGKDAIKIVNSIFSGDLNKVGSHTINYGHIIYQNEIIDEVLLMLMKGPKTYTTEDTIEINSHGGFNVTNKILEILLNLGCRLAEPGEFTKRAFLNGRINLLQSEAVNELIKARTESQRKLCLNQIGNKLTNMIDSLREDILKLMANIEVNIDYPEFEDNLIITNNLLNDKLKELSKKLSEISDNTKYGKIVSEGINVAIIGRPNVGKSSVLNAFLDEEKAIVTDVAGTTRDLIEGIISLKGIELKLIDTAGIHETKDCVEKIGVNKSKELTKIADLVILVLDGSEVLSDEDKDLLNQADDRFIIFVNKNDKKLNINIDDKKYNIIYGNTKNPDGLKNLKDEIIEKYKINDINRDLTYLSNARQIILVKKANDTLSRAKKSLEDNIPIDIIESDLKECYELLGELIGKSYNNDVINQIFQDFCVGK